MLGMEDCFNMQAARQPWTIGCLKEACLVRFGDGLCDVVAHEGVGERLAANQARVH